MVELVLPHKSLDYGNTSEIRIGDTFLGCCINGVDVKAIARFGILDVIAAKVVAPTVRRTSPSVTGSAPVLTAVKSAAEAASIVIGFICLLM